MQRRPARRASVEAATLCFALLVYAVLAIPALRIASFSGPDAARHAMNGVFIADFLRDLPLDRIEEYTNEYFVRFPAIGFTWHLPVFHLVESLSFLFGGISVFSAQVTVLAFGLAGIAAWYCWVRSVWGVITALLSTLLFATNQQVHLWATAVYLEIPTVSLMCFSLLTLHRYIERPGWGRGLLFGAVAAAMLLTKQTAIFLLPVLVLYPILVGRRDLIWARTSFPVWTLVGTALAISAMHAAVLGSVGVAERLGGLDPYVAPRSSLERWTLYGGVIGRIFEIPLLALVAIGVARMAVKEKRPEDILILVWIALWYFSFTITAGRDSDATRYATYVALPIALVACRLYLAFPLRSVRPRQLFVAGVACLGLWGAWRSWATEVPFVASLEDPAVFALAESGTRPILYCCRYDGEFIFEMRRADPKRQSIVLRADKLLVSFSVLPEFGIRSYVATRADILALIDRNGVATLAIESRDTVGVPELALLIETVKGPEFELLAEYPIGTSNIHHRDVKLGIYRYRDAKPAEGTVITIPAPQLGRDLTLQLPSSGASQLGEVDDRE
jgi:hypothetical protein